MDGHTLRKDDSQESNGVETLLITRRAKIRKEAESLRKSWDELKIFSKNSSQWNGCVPLGIKATKEENKIDLLVHHFATLGH